jgi:hypothetical protein
VTFFRGLEMYVDYEGAAKMFRTSMLQETNEAAL